MTVTFEWQTFLEDDDRWSSLFVRIDNGPWKMTMANWGTENIERVLSHIQQILPIPPQPKSIIRTDNKFVIH